MLQSQYYTHSYMQYAQQSHVYKITSESVHHPLVTSQYLDVIQQNFHKTLKKLNYNMQGRLPTS